SVGGRGPPPQGSTPLGGPVLAAPTVSVPPQGGARARLGYQWGSGTPGWAAPAGRGGLGRQAPGRGPARSRGWAVFPRPPRSRRTGRFPDLARGSNALAVTGCGPASPRAATGWWEPEDRPGRNPTTNFRTASLATA
ncbi:hypothetical protein P7K49_027878, partial [Saguinus oedipus]